MILKVVSPKGKYKDPETYANVINYCCSPNKAKHGYIGMYGLNRETAAEEMEALTLKFGKKEGGTRIRHMILSFEIEEQKYITPYDASQIAHEACKFYKNEFQILYAVHENYKRLHIHIVMNTVRFTNGKKYEGNKKDYFAFLKRLQRIVRPYDFKVRTQPDNGIDYWGF